MAAENEVSNPQVLVGDSMKISVITISVFQGYYFGEGTQLLDQPCGCISYARYSLRV
jgi:hypothetical protein